MTIEDLIARIEGLDPWLISAVFLAPLLLTILLRILHRNGYGGDSPWRYLYSFIVYYAALPGVLACLLTGYSIFFIRQNLLSVNLVVYFLPIASMIATFVVVKRTVDWDDIPGVDRLFAFLTMLAISFMIVLVILKMRIWVIFGGSIFMLGVIAIICYLILKASFNTMTKGKDGRFSDSDSGSSRRTSRRSKAEADLRRIKRKMKID